jgi:hypothetical protein
MQVVLGETFAREYFEGAHPAEQTPMFTAPPFHNLVAVTLQMAQLADICDTHLISLEREAVRFENVASRLEEEDRQAVLVFVAGLGQEIQALHRQIEPVPGPSGPHALGPHSPNRRFFSSFFLSRLRRPGCESIPPEVVECELWEVCLRQLGTESCCYRWSVRWTERSVPQSFRPCWNYAFE